MEYKVTEEFADLFWELRREYDELINQTARHLATAQAEFNKQDFHMTRASLIVAESILEQLIKERANLSLSIVKNIDPTSIYSIYI